MTRTIPIGGASKAELWSRLQRAGVQCNEAAQTLFADARFTTAAERSSVELVERSVASLGFSRGATFGQLVAQASPAGLSLCPLEVGPHFRLHYLDQPEGFLGHPPSQNRAPPGSLTVASAPLDDADETPKGFYLRRIEGVLWLRGFRAGPEHVYSPEDMWVFARGRQGVGQVKEESE